MSMINKKPIVSILDRDFEEFEVKEKLLNKNIKKDEIKEEANIGGNESRMPRKKLSHVVREILELYRQMKHE